MLFMIDRMEHGTEHWGEVPESRNAGTEVIASELRNLLVLKAMKPDPFKVHQPCTQDDSLVE
jgi:hypothetical protein